MTVHPAQLSCPPLAEGAAWFVPTGQYRGSLEEFDYVEEEWFATGEVEGHIYRTTMTVRRPRDGSRFSGVVVVEPVHAASAAPIWIYTSTFLMRSGHGWAAICSQKSALEAFVKPANPERYASLEIWSDAGGPEASGINPLMGLPREPAAMQARMEQMRRINVLSTPILTQVGAALGGGAGPFAGLDLRHVVLAGHSQTGGVVTDYIVNGHDAPRLQDGSPSYDGFFPTGSPSVTFGPCDVPIVQVLSDGDISDPNRPGREGRKYRRDDGDDPGDRYRLYELAGVGHMGTRYPPYSDNATWQNDPLGTAGSVPRDTPMNSLPHGELFSMALHHLVRWVADGVAPPRADRIEVDPNGLLAKDEYGNSRGGVRCAQMDVPRLTYFSNPGVKEDGTPAFGVVGIEEPLPPETLKELYPHHAAYVERFNRRLDELIAQGWFLAEDADGMRAEAENAGVP
ncbi:MAG: alpha/beta hydrolase domain-containing protein [Acidimicrobiales bacterium]